MSGCEPSERKRAPQSQQHPDLPKPSLWSSHHIVRGDVFAQEYEDVFQKYREHLQLELEKTKKETTLAYRRLQPKQLWLHAIFEARKATEAMTQEAKKVSDALLLMETCIRDDIKRMETEKEIEKEEAVATPIVDLSEEIPEDELGISRK